MFGKKISRQQKALEVTTVRPDLGLNCLQRLSADNSSKQRVNSLDVVCCVAAENRTARKANVVPTKSDSDVIFCLQLLSKRLSCTLHLS